jgi:hypothetical protein
MFSYTLSYLYAFVCASIYIKYTIFLRYAHWNAYTYNQQANPAAYSYGGSGSTGAPSPGTSSYSQYPDQQTNSQYSYAPSNPASANDYYSHYGYSAPQTAAVYGEPNGKFILVFFNYKFVFMI